MDDNYRKKLDGAIETVFKHADKNHNGVLEPKECYCFVKELFYEMEGKKYTDQPTDEEVLKMCNKLDPNKDGQITLEEFKKIIYEETGNIADYIIPN